MSTLSVATICSIQLGYTVSSEGETVKLVKLLFNEVLFTELKFYVNFCLNAEIVS